MPTLGFGKHADEPIENVPEDYLNWLIKNSQEKIDICKLELDRRAGRIDNSIMAQIVKLGHQAIQTQLPQSEHAKTDKAKDVLMRAITDAANTKKDPQQ
jgi:hypothetical protein